MFREVDRTQNPERDIAQTCASVVSRQARPGRLLGRQAEIVLRGLRIGPGELSEHAGVHAPAGKIPAVRRRSARNPDRIVLTRKRQRGEGIGRSSSSLRVNADDRKRRCLEVVTSGTQTHR